MPVKPFLVPGNNTLTFRISPAVEAAQLRAAAYPYPVPSLCETPPKTAVPCSLRLNMAQRRCCTVKTHGTAEANTMHAMRCGVCLLSCVSRRCIAGLKRLVCLAAGLVFPTTPW